MDFSESIKDLFERMVINSTTLSLEEKEQMLTHGFNESTIDAPPVFFDFEKEKILEAELIGNAPDYIEGDRPIKCWAFRDKQKNIYHVPKYTQLNEIKGSFQGFDKEQPGKYYYQIIFTGEQKLDDNNFIYLFTVNRKLNATTFKDI